MNMTDEMTDTDRQHIIDIFTWKGMCSDCLEELKFALKGAKMSDNSSTWCEFLCYECELIYEDMVPEAIKLRKQQERKNEDQ
jgi:hypothetical protein